MKTRLFSMPSMIFAVDVDKDNKGNMNNDEGQGYEDAALQEENVLVNENSTEVRGTLEI